MKKQKEIKLLSNIIMEAKQSKYKTNKEYRDKQIKRQQQKIVCDCDCILSYSSIWSHKLSNKHQILLLKKNDPIEYSKIVSKKKYYFGSKSKKNKCNNDNCKRKRIAIPSKISLTLDIEYPDD